MLQVIKAEEVLDGERCGLFRTMARAMDAIADLKHEPRPLLLWDQPMPVSEFPYAIVDRPAPTPAPAPGLDLDAVERAERAMTPGPWRHGSVERHHVFCSEGDRSLLCPEAGRVLLRMNEHFPHDSDAAGIVALRNAAPALIAEVRALRAEVAKLNDRETGWRDMVDDECRKRISAEYDARTEIARLTAELAAARAEVDCGQDGPCAQAPGCARHWQERNRELADELAAARAVPGGVEAAIGALLHGEGYSTDDTEIVALRTAIARAISDATAAATESLKNGMRRVFKCSAHNVDPTKAWGCPDCLAELRRATAARETVGGLLATAPVCPGPDCPMCNGEACDKCNPGPGRPRCDHDSQERHELPTIAPRCSCTHEAGDSRCDAHPSCSECGDSISRNVDDCADHCQVCASLRRGDVITDWTATCQACKSRGPLPKGG